MLCAMLRAVLCCVCVCVCVRGVVLPNIVLVFVESSIVAFVLVFVESSIVTFVLVFLVAFWSVCPQVEEVISHSPQSSHSSSWSTEVAHQGLAVADSLVVQVYSLSPSELNLKGKTQGVPSVVEQGREEGDLAGTSCWHMMGASHSHTKGSLHLISLSYFLD